MLVMQVYDCCSSNFLRTSTQKYLVTLLPDMWNNKTADLGKNVKCFCKLFAINTRIFIKYIITN